MQLSLKVFVHQSAYKISKKTEENGLEEQVFNKLVHFPINIHNKMIQSLLDELVKVKVSMLRTSQFRAVGLLAWCESREKVQTQTHFLCPPEQRLARSAWALRQSQ